jgi:SAM-dependent methyltransferase
VLMHRFDESSVDEDLPAIIANELGPIGLVTTALEFDETLGAIIASSVSRESPVCLDCGRVHVDLGMAWRRYCLNSLVRYRQLLSEERAAPAPQESHIAQFAAVYRRIIDCCVGVNLLDVGSSLGFLPLLVAEHHADMTVVGCDNRQEVLSCASDVSPNSTSNRISFLHKSLLDEDFQEIGKFDTVTAVHLLEHLAEDELPLALSNLVEVTSRRLIVAVPYEEKMEVLYGHQQVFTPEKLSSWGQWCVETLGCQQYWCEDVRGGLLIVDRYPVDANVG